jgi:hypothetical protein
MPLLKYTTEIDADKTAMEISKMPGFSDTLLQRAFMCISGQYPMKVLHTQGIRTYISGMVRLCSAGDSFAQRFHDASHK